MCIRDRYTDEWLSKRVFPNISLRLDKNQYFSTRITPRFSMVYDLDNQSSKFLRLSAQTAFRFPSVVDQWTDLYVAPVNVVGGQSVLQDQYNLRDSNIYPLRISVFRSNKSIYSQIIDDTNGHTLVSSSSSDVKMFGKNNLESCKKVGLKLAEKAKKKGIKSVLFDRSGYRYHGRIKSFADGAREGGLKF